MTARPAQSPADLAQQEVLALLERVLPHGYSLTHTRGHWYVKRWDSWINPSTGPRMAWKDVDEDKSLAALLDRLGREGTGNG